MDGWMWGSITMAIAIVIAGGITWWLAKGCAVTLTGAAGGILGGVAALLALALLVDPDVAFRVSAGLTGVAGVWLLAFALAGGIRGQRLARAEAAQAAAPPSLPSQPIAQ
ncbi:hypothetical protein JOD63_000426 [Microbacterium terrae]|nr:hypothetical protein [Microbacterium terrae]MBP1076458.1 hypothetical protein [Microbacterium terrae]